MPQRLTACVALATLLVAAPITSQQAPSASSAPISSSFLSHIRFLSSDDLGGRGNGTDGLRRAGDYIAEAFERAGVEPAGDGGTYFQSFDADVNVEPPAGSPLVIRSPAGEATLALGDQYYPISIVDRTTGAPEPSIDRAPLVFAGYGITAPALGYDDYAGLDVTGKAVLIFTHEPQEADPSSAFDGTALTPGGAIANKVAEARRRGAAMLLVADDPSHRVDYAVSRSWWNDPQSDEFGIPVVRVARARLAQALPGVDFDRDAREIDLSLAPRSRVLPRVTVSYTEHRARLRPSLRNVVGIVGGADPARAGAVLVGGHYDHLGAGGRFSASPDLAGTTHNGAYDNASGAAGVIEVCRAAARQAPRLARTVICAAFAGEELGRLGSEFYATHPVRPLGQTLAMVNLDMIGRARGRVLVGFFGAGAWMEGLRDQMKAWTRLAVTDFSQGGYAEGSSDEASFSRRGVPTIVFFTGFHADYHRPTDDWQKIDAQGGAQVAALAWRLVQRLGR